jgi:signal peptidase I
LDREELSAAEEFDLDEIMKLLEEPAPQPESPSVDEPSQADCPAETVSEDKQEQETVPQKQEIVSLGKTVLLYLHDLVYLLAFVVVALSLCFRMVIVDGDSMYNTLVDGDYLLLVSNVIYHDPKPGDIVVASKDSFRHGDPIVKRVIATEGQTVNIDFGTGTVYVDGEALVEDYIYTPTTNPEGMNFPLIVEDGCIFVMGDNRGRSMDSRDPEIGLIDVREVMGKAILLLVPGDDGGKAQRDFSRFGVIS